MSVIKNPLLLYREDLKNPFKNVKPTVDIYNTSKYLFLKDLFIFYCMYMSVLTMCILPYGAQRDQKRLWLPWSWNYTICEPTCWMLGTKHKFSARRMLLTTESLL